MSDKSLKVTDRRMFTPDGELREEFKNLEEVPPGAGSPPAATGSAPGAAPEPADRPGPDRPDPDPSSGSRPLAPERDRGAPGFLDLVGLLAEPAAHYMRETHDAPPQTARQSLALARLHIDLLAVLKDKTQGNLTPEEKEMLDDVVYQLRSGFVGLGG